MALDTEGLRPLDTSDLEEVEQESRSGGLDTKGLTPLDTTGLSPVEDGYTPPEEIGGFNLRRNYGGSRIGDEGAEAMDSDGMSREERDEALRELDRWRRLAVPPSKKKSEALGAEASELEQQARALEERRATISTEQERRAFNRDLEAFNRRAEDFRKRSEQYNASAESYNETIQQNEDLRASLREGQAPSHNALERTVQNVAEAGKAIPGGTVSLGGTSLTGMGATSQGFLRDQLTVMDRIDSGEPVPEQEDPIGYQHMTPEQQQQARARIEDLASQPLEETPLVETGREITEFGRGLFPAEPGYEESIGRQLGQGLGSVAAGVGVSALPGGQLAGPAIFAFAGSGEAVERAIEDGASEEQIIEAARLGVIPGMTDSVPVEVLLGRIPIPGGKAINVPTNMLGDALRVSGRIGFQAFIEGFQEGGQEWLQNMIARDTYKPEQELGEGVVPSAGIGSGVGAVSEAARLALRNFAGRRRGAPPEPTGERERARETAPPPTPEDESSPIPTDLIQQGQETVRDAQGSQSANKILEEAGFPTIGSRVTVTLPDNSEATGTVEDAFSDDPRGPGPKIRLDDGRMIAVPFPALEGRVRQEQQEETQPAAEGSAPQSERVRIQTPQGEVTGTVESRDEAGNVDVRTDEGMAFRFGPDDPVQVLPEQATDDADLPEGAVSADTLYGPVAETEGEQTAGQQQSPRETVTLGRKWQEIEQGSSLPQGAEVRYDAESGRLYARRPDAQQPTESQLQSFDTPAEGASSDNLDLTDDEQFNAEYRRLQDEEMERKDAGETGGLVNALELAALPGSVTSGTFDGEGNITPVAAVSAIQTARDEGRHDIVDLILERADREYSDAQGTEPRLSPDDPNYQRAKESLERNARNAESAREQIYEAAGLDVGERKAPRDRQSGARIEDGEQASKPEEALGDFSPSDYVERLRRYVQRTNKPINPEAIGKELGIAPDQARRVLGVLAGTPNSGLQQTRGGNLRRTPRARGPVDAARFLASRGGVRDDAGHDLRRGRNLQTITPAGPLIRNTGLSIDDAGEALWQAGYFGPPDTTERPSEDQVLELLERTSRQRVYRPEDTEQIESQRREQEQADEERAVRDEVRAFGREIGQPLSESDISAILSIMSADGLDAEGATDLYVERLAIQAAEDLERETGDQSYEEIPFGEPLEPAQDDQAPGARSEGPTRQQQDAGEGQEGSPPAEGPGAPGGQQTQVTTEQTDQGEQQPASQQGRAAPLTESEARQEALRLIRGGQETAGVSQTADGRRFNWSIGQPVSPKVPRASNQLQIEDQRGEIHSFSVAELRREIAGEQSTQQQAPTVEQTEQGEQNVLPGAEQESQRQQTERGMEGRQRGQGEQRGVDGLELFDPDSRPTAQQDIFDQPQTAVESAPSDLDQGPLSGIEQGQPGISIEQQGVGEGRNVRVVQRDEQGNPIGVLSFPTTPEGRVNAESAEGIIVFVRPENRRQGVASRLYDAAIEAGFDVDAISGARTLTNDGRSFVSARQERRGTESRPIDSDTLATGQPIRGTLYRVDGISPEQMYRGAQVPILGDGAYGALTQEGARSFAEDQSAQVREEPVNLENPLVITNDQEWRALTREAGWEFPNPFGLSQEETQTQVDALQRLVQSRGHDGVAVVFPDTPYDMDENNNSIKNIRNVFGAPQVVSYRGQQQEAATETPFSQEGAQPANAGQSRIDDFGEVLEGARKHYAQQYRDQIAEAAESDTESLPLSRAWPEPNYQQLVDDGVDPWVVGFVHAARDEVPAKPRKDYRVREWARQVEMLRDGLTRHLLSGAITKEQVLSKLEERQFRRMRKELGDRADLYAAAGHEKSLRGVKMALGTYSVMDGQELDPPQTLWTVQRDPKATAFSNWPRQLAKGETREDAIADFVERYNEIETQPKASKQVRFEIYSYRGQEGYWIGKKIGRDQIDLRHFSTVKEARQFLANNREQLEQDLEAFRHIPDHRKENDAPRVGEDHRQGEDATPDLFSETFGFKGVQFGNYVRGAERQQSLNEAYDALLDLAGVLNLPARALSLNGELGLAFGARGKGGRSGGAAHYEPDTVVINLTKNKGAGSLAHEWWHALDNYFSRQRGEPTQFMTNRPKSINEGVRPEMVQAFQDVISTIRTTGMAQRSRNLDKRRTKAYWSTDIEMSARAFESYIIAKLQDAEQANDYLANIVSEEIFAIEDGYPYARASELPEIRAAFDGFFNTVEVQETDQGAAMYSVEGTSNSSNDAAPFISEDRAWRDALGERSPASVAGNRAARRFVLDRGRLDDSEHMVIIDTSQGRTASVGTTKQHTAVRFEPGMNRQTLDPSFALVGHHNHPQKTALSGGDVALLGGGGLRLIFAHGNGGVMTAARLTPEAKRAMAKGGEENRTVLRRLHNAAYYGVYDTFIGAIRDGRLTVEEANEHHPELNNRILAELGVIEYFTSFSEADNPAYREALDEGKRRVRDAAQRQIPGLQLSDGGRAIAVRANFDMAKVLGEDAPGAGGRSRGADGDRTRRGSDRAEGEGGPVSPEQLQLLEGRPLFAAHLNGDELGQNLTFRQLRDNALNWFRNNLQGGSVVNAETGRTIQFGNAGSKRTVSGKGEDLLRLVPALRDILEKGSFLESMADRRGRPDVKAIHVLSAQVILDGRPLDVVALVRETQNGDFYYDLRKDNQPGARWAVGRTTTEGLVDDQVPTPALEGDAEQVLNISASLPTINPETGTLTREGVIEHLRRGPLGGMTDTLIEGGHVVLHHSRQSLGASTPDGVHAATTPDGTIHLVSSALTPETATPALLHEAFHSHVEPLLGTRQWKKLQRDLKRVAEHARNTNGRSNRIWRESQQRVENAESIGVMMSDAQKIEEFGAYAIENYENAPQSLRKVVDDIIGHIKAWLQRRFSIQAGQVTPSQLRALAAQALRSHARKKAPRAEGEYQSYSISDVLPGEAGQTQTPEFRRWFGDSKVVDANGEPLVVYHGTTTDGSIFDRFDEGRTQSVVGFFSPSAEFAATFSDGDGATVMPVYLRVERPFDANSEEDVAALGKELGMSENEGVVEEVDGGLYTGIEKPHVIDAIQAAGFDGAYVLDGPDGPVNIAVFRPDQIKSATGNQGTFDPNNPDIRYSIGKPSDKFDDLSDTQKSFLDKIGPETVTQSLGDRFRQMRENLALRVRQAGVDRYAALLRNDQAIHGEDTLEGSIASSSWVLARMSNSAGGAVSAMLNHGRLYLDKEQKVLDIREGTTGLREVLNQLGSPAEVDRFMGWVAANRARMLSEQGRENLFTPDEIDAGIGLSQGQLSDGRNRPVMYNWAWQEFKQYRADVLEIAEQAGIITSEQRETWAEEFYVPFYRILEDDNVGGPGRSDSLARQQAYKELKGGTQNLNDLLENTLLNFHHLLQASLKNQAALQAVENAEALGIATPTTEEQRDRKMSTFVLKNGERQWYDIEDGLTFKALSALNHAGLNNPAMKILRGFKRIFTNMTTITPQFMVANTLRDSLSAMATSPTSPVPFLNALRGGASYGHAGTRARMLASGASFDFGYVYGQDPDSIRTSLRGNMRRAKVLSDPQLIPGVLVKSWRAWNDVTNVAENVNRAGIFERNQAQGKLRAAFESRDLMDFSAHGDAIALRIMIDTIPFLNARIQGLDKLYRSGVKPGAKTVAGRGTASDKKKFARFGAVIGALAIMEMLNYLNNWDDEEYRKLEDWQKDTYWVFRFGDNMFFIPKPFEVGAIATMAGRALEQYVDPTVGGGKFLERIGAMLTDTFSMDMPQAVKPSLEVLMNRDTFTDRPIENIGMQRLSPSLRSRPDSSFISEYVSEGMEETLGRTGMDGWVLSPVQIDHLIRGYLGSVGASGAALADTIWRRAHGEEKPYRHWHEYQPIRRFYKDLTQEDYYTAYATEFYEALKEADQAYSDIQHLKRYGELEEARSVMNKSRHQLEMRKALNRVQRDLSDISRQMKIVQSDEELSAEAKRMKLDRLRSLRNAIQKRVGKELERRRAERTAAE
ncbi:LPD5 domain-containing protein [Fodinicurvata sediminis]|uniref:LPD5 domain-containing protein n=1 Tax=Fodinicurvata sediminis TaxID=1121832 RepID=UPI0003B6D2DC|nr:LPD5 domain-containing protein [Fodinicurvata sediminis]